MMMVTNGNGENRHTEPDRWVPNVWKGFTVRYFIIHIIFMYCVHDVHVYIVHLSAYARQPARGPTMLAHLVAMLAYVGVRWPILKKQCKMQEILMVGGLSWGYVGPPWGYVALS